jgi:hypothetical protein
MKKKILIAAAALAVIVAASLTIMAATDSGTQSNPLVTLSYLNEQFAPQIKADLRAELAAAEAELAKKFSDSAASGTVQPAAPAAGTVFSVVTLSRGQTVSCAVGTELLLRIGSASAVGGAPGLVDSTGGTTLAAGGALTANHLYMVTIEGNGIKAGADSVKVMIRGGYTVT